MTGLGSGQVVLALKIGLSDLDIKQSHLGVSVTEQLHDRRETDAGAHHFGVEAFEPATCKVLMAALLVHDLQAGVGPAHAHPWQDEAHAAAHGGLWRIAYAPRSALGLAAALGFSTAGK